MTQNKAVKHIIKEGSREHVISYNKEGRHCSEPSCEINNNKAVEKAIEYLKKKEFWDNMDWQESKNNKGSVKWEVDRITEALSICAEEAEKQGYEKGLGASNWLKDLKVRSQKEAYDRGAEQKAKEIFDDLEKHNDVLLFRTHCDGCRVTWDRLKQKHLKGDKL